MAAILAFATLVATAATFVALAGDNGDALGHRHEPKSGDGTLSKKTVALAALCLVAAAAAQAAPQAGDPTPVIAAEHAFAARAAEIGVAPSFLEFMTDEAIVFSP